MSSDGSELIRLSIHEALLQVATENSEVRQYLQIRILGITPLGEYASLTSHKAVKEDAEDFVTFVSDQIIIAISPTAISLIIET